MCQEVVLIMSCYHPILGIPDRDLGLSDTGHWHYKLSGPWDPFAEKLDPAAIKIPCGKCIGCRLDRSREWADRMMFELDSFGGKGIFLTLTYNNDHVPIAFDQETGEAYGFSLYKRDLQLFFKRCRRHFDDRKISYYASGEYGDKTGRPHYHTIIFGLDLSDFPDRIERGTNELGQLYFISKLLDQLWFHDGSTIGFHCLSAVSYKTCAYVARYTMKKVFGSQISEFIEPEFSLMSRRPAIGRRYLDEHPDVFDLSRRFFSDSNGSVQVSLPKYFLYRLRLQDPEAYDNFIEERKSIALDRELLKLSRTSLSFVELNELEENSLLNKTKILFKRREEFNDET